MSSRANCGTSFRHHEASCCPWKTLFGTDHLYKNEDRRRACLKSNNFGRSSSDETSISSHTFRFHNHGFSSCVCVNSRYKFKRCACLRQTSKRELHRCKSDWLEQQHWRKDSSGKSKKIKSCTAKCSFQRSFFLIQSNHSEFPAFTHRMSYRKNSSRAWSDRAETY